jgi:hypothetical protein
MVTNRFPKSGGNVTWLFLALVTICLISAIQPQRQHLPAAKIREVLINGLHLGQARSEIKVYLKSKGYCPGGARLGFQECYLRDTDDSLRFSFDSSGSLQDFAGDLFVLKAGTVTLVRDMPLDEVKKILGEPTKQSSLPHARSSIYYEWNRLHLIFDGSHLKRFRLEQKPN